MESRHDSVLMKEVIKALSVQPGDTVVDATIGGAGHFSALLAALGEGGVIVGIDADPAAVERGRSSYALDRRPERPVAHLVNDNFRNLSRILERLSVGQADAILFDLCWSGYQIAAPRGFSFQNDEPLLMTYGDGVETAADVVNSSSEEQLVDIIFTYGEERFARGIARDSVRAREGANPHDKCSCRRNQSWHAEVVSRRENSSGYKNFSGAPYRGQRRDRRPARGARCGAQLARTRWTSRRHLLPQHRRPHREKYSARCVAGRTGDAFSEKTDSADTFRNTE